MSFTEDRKRQHTPGTANRWGKPQAGDTLLQLYNVDLMTALPMCLLGINLPLSCVCRPRQLRKGVEMEFDADQKENNDPIAPSTKKVTPSR